MTFIFDDIKVEHRSIAIRKFEDKPINNIRRNYLGLYLIVSNLVVIVGNINEGGIAILAYESQGFV